MKFVNGINRTMKENEIIEKIKISDSIYEMTIYTPLICKNCQPGQFVIIRSNADSERIPLTIFKYEKSKGMLSLLIQDVGYSTHELVQKEVGDCIHDFLGPLGNHTELTGNKILLVSGGIGVAVIYSQIKKLKEDGKVVDVVLAAKTKSLIMYEADIRNMADNLYIVTDDGSYGDKGFAVDEVNSLLAKNKYDCVFAVGPMIMMKTVADATRDKKIKTVVSMNPIMVDGTGMCGSCRLTVSGKLKYACIDGPEFDGHEVDFNEAVMRNSIYKEQEHRCNIRGKW